ncbi:MAG: methylmalonyl Co-A mutase-associated GTPase MeaB [Myxococcales bacterium]|nr:methylmalonyl Co-A mutase-associated GTPase MeaB [Myxococcales bacterium]
MPRRLPLDAYVDGVRAGDRAIVGRAITLIESQRADDQALGRALIERLIGDTGRAHRIGVTGVPGAGKSTFIEALGTRLCAAGHRVAVLAVDPSSARSGGSILGDKTRMQELAREPRAFVRPSPSLGALGGVARHSREAVLICEAAGYDLVLIETVGVGQSEVMVAHLVDTFLLLMIPGAGDELQGIKRGILELADLVAVNKADGDRVTAAERARRDYGHALHLMQPRSAGWQVPVLTCSAQSGAGIDALWAKIVEHRRHLEASGEWQRSREEQQVFWMWRALEERLLAEFRGHPAVQARLGAIEAAVRSRRLSPDHAAAELLALFSGRG